MDAQSCPAVPPAPPTVVYWIAGTGPSSWQLQVPGVSREFRRCGGVRTIYRLVGRPHAGVDVRELAFPRRGQADDHRRERHAEGWAALNEADPEGCQEGRRWASRGWSLGWSRQTLTDWQTYSEIRRRLEEIEHELSVVRRLGGRAAQERLLTERSRLLDYVSETVGPARRLRLMSGLPAERARSAVANAVTRAYKQIEKAHPAFHPLVQHLRASIELGAVCVYKPAAPAPRWELSSYDPAA